MLHNGDVHSLYSLLHTCYEKNKVNRACSNHGISEEYFKMFWEHKGRENLTDLCIGSMVVTELFVKMRTGMSCFRIECGGRHSGPMNANFTH
jgi:hypothetical protein